MEVHQFNVKSLTQACLEVITDHLCPENCIGFWKFSNAILLVISDKLQKEAFHCICENFKQVSLCEEFVQLEMQELADILDRDDLTVAPESTVYQSVLRWITHMQEERQQAIATLLPKVRLGLMDKSYIRDNVLNNDVVKTNPESHLLVFKTLQVMSNPELLSSQPGIDKTLFCPRLPNAVLLMLGSYFKTIEAFDYSTNRWITVNLRPSLENPINHFGVGTVCLGRYLYSVGGFNEVDMNSVWRLNLVTHTWQEMSPMKESRNSMSVSVLKGCIYVMGGFRNGSTLRTAERYQPHINQWTFIASMNDERFRASCTTMNNKIYICGGRSNITLKTAECYNPDTNQWTLIAPMGTPRLVPGVVAYMGHIFAVGGNDESRVLRSAEAYNPESNTWHAVPEMVHRHYCVSIAVMNNRIFVVSNYEKNVECYDSTTNTWSVVCSDLNTHCTLDRCCVISGLPNMAEYCCPREPVLPRTGIKKKKAKLY